MTSPDSLDPSDWQNLRTQGHRMLDDMLDYLEHIRARPVWQPIPQEVRALFKESLPQEPSDLAAVHDTFMQNVLPYCRRQRPSGLHGLGSWRWNTGRHAG